MVRCDVENCDEVLDYLPFKCRYCGGTFCKKHRLPENHNCSFTMEETPSFQTTTENLYNESTAPEIYSDDAENGDSYERKLDREMRNYIRNQERSAMPPPPNSDSSRVRSFSNPFSRMRGDFKATYWLIGLNLAFFVVGFFINQAYLLLNIFGLIFNFRGWTLITALFVNPGNYSFLGILSLLFTMFLLFFAGRMLERQFSPKIFIQIYVISALVGGAGALLYQLLMSYLGIGASENFAISLFSIQGAALSGIYSFMIFLIGLNREMRLYLYFIPVRMKSKYILYVMAGFDLVYIILGLFGVVTPGPSLSSFAQLIAIAMGYYFYKKHGRIYSISRFI